MRLVLFSRLSGEYDSLRLVRQTEISSSTWGTFREIARDDVEQEFTLLSNVAPHSTVREHIRSHIEFIRKPRVVSAPTLIEAHIFLM